MMKFRMFIFTAIGCLPMTYLSITGAALADSKLNAAATVCKGAIKAALEENGGKGGRIRVVRARRGKEISLRYQISGSGARSHAECRVKDGAVTSVRFETNATAVNETD